MSNLPLQYFRPHGYQPIHNSNEHMHGAHIPVTSLHFVGIVGGNDSIACSSDENEAPENKKWKKKI